LPRSIPISPSNSACLFPEHARSDRGRPELLLQDGIHPTERRRAMADGIAGFLEPL